MRQPKRYLKLPPVAVPAIASGTFALGSLALGALEVGALAIGALAIYRLRIERADAREFHLGKVEIDDLTVRRLRVIESDEGTGGSS